MYLNSTIYFYSNNNLIFLLWYWYFYCEFQHKKHGHPLIFTNVRVCQIALKHLLRVDVYKTYKHSPKLSRDIRFYFEAVKV